MGALVIFWNLIALPLNLVTSVLPLLQDGDIVAALMSSALSLVTGILFPLIWMAFGAVIAYGGNCLRSGQNAPVVYAASIMAMIPCCSGVCCCLGIPIGIWAIVTMQDEQVAAAFAEA